MARTRTPTISMVGARVDIEVRQGSTLTFDQWLVDQNDAPFDLTGCSFRAYIRKGVREVAIVAKFDVTIADAAMGLVTYTLDADVTGAMDAGETLTAIRSRYVWDSEIHLPDGTISPLFFGEFRLQPEITRDEDVPVTP